MRVPWIKQNFDKLVQCRKKHGFVGKQNRLSTAALQSCTHKTDFSEFLDNPEFKVWQVVRVQPIKALIIRSDQKNETGGSQMALKISPRDWRQPNSWRKWWFWKI